MIILPVEALHSLHICLSGYNCEMAVHANMNEIDNTDQFEVLSELAVMPAADNMLSVHRVEC